MYVYFLKNATKQQNYECQTLKCVFMAWNWQVPDHKANDFWRKKYSSDRSTIKKQCVWTSRNMII